MVIVKFSNEGGVLDKQRVTEGRSVGEVLIRMIEETGTFNIHPGDTFVVQEEDDED